MQVEDNRECILLAGVVLERQKKRKNEKEQTPTLFPRARDRHRETLEASLYAWAMQKSKKERRTLEFSVVRKGEEGRAKGFLKRKRKRL